MQSQGGFVFLFEYQFSKNLDFYLNLFFYFEHLTKDPSNFEKPVKQRCSEIQLKSVWCRCRTDIGPAFTEGVLADVYYHILEVVGIAVR